MERQFVTYPIAKLLKELKYNEPCLAYHHSREGFYLLDSPNDDDLPTNLGAFSDTGESEKHLFTAPLWQQVIDWILLEKNHVIQYRTKNRELMEKEIIDILNYILEKEKTNN